MSEFKLIEKTLGQLLRETAQKFPDQDAIVYYEKELRFTWKEFDERVDMLAKGLMALGIKKDEKVAIWATNVPYWVELMFATARIGAILLTVNTSYRDNEIKYLLQQSDTETLCVIEGVRDHDFISTVYSVIPELKKGRTNLQIADLPHFKRVILLGEENHRGMYTIDEVCKLHSQISEEEYLERQNSLSPHDVINMQYTSGTTGFPKGVMLTHSGILNNGYHIGENQKLTNNDKVCIPVPLFHCFGCVLGVLACVNHGACMVIIEAFSPIHVMSSIDQEKCTALYGVPSMYLSILEHRLFKKFNYSSLRTGIMSGAVCPEPLMRRVLEELNMKEITIPYGLTEGSPVMTMTKTDEKSMDNRCQTVGTAMPGIEVCIFDPDTDEILPPNTAGEVRCRGYNVMKGYYNMPEATAAAIDNDGWLHSGDLGVINEEGYLRITGRIKDMIIRGGENIYPREIEEFLLGMPEIHDVQIVGIPSKKYGEEVVAFIIPKPDKEVHACDIRDFCRGNIAWHKIPRHTTIVDSFPMTASGKIQKYKLREAAAQLYSHLA